mmetsp:Transcript_20168/g.30558  ORF Transcript_20168/g.30558 Transcript_20168/m.30558 type:complete len:174 (+) Transcript_20168:128-649(+)
MINSIICTNTSTSWLEVPVTAAAQHRHLHLATLPIHINNISSIDLKGLPIHLQIQGILLSQVQVQGSNNLTCTATKMSNNHLTRQACQCTKALSCSHLINRGKYRSTHEHHQDLQMTPSHYDSNTTCLYNKEFIHTYIHTSGEGRAKYGNDDNDDDERFTIYNSQIELRFTKI